MDTNKLGCLTTENSDVKTGRAYMIMAGLGASYLGIPMLVAIIVLALNYRIGQSATQTSVDLFAVGLMALAFLLPVGWGWFKFRRRDRAFSAMFHDPSGKKLLEAGDLLVRQLQEIDQTERRLLAALNDLNQNSGWLGQGTPPFVESMSGIVKTHGDDLREIVFDRATALHDEQRAYLRGIRAIHGLREPLEMHSRGR